MAPKPRLALDPIADLSRRLARRHSVALATCVARWWSEQALGDHPATVGKRIAFALLQHTSTDAKHAGIVLLHVQLADHLGAADLATCEALFARGALVDGAVVDWFAVKVL